MPGSGSRMAISDHPATRIDGEVSFVAQLSWAILAGNQSRLWIGLAHVRLIGELTSPFSALYSAAHAFEELRLIQNTHKVDRLGGRNDESI